MIRDVREMGDMRVGWRRRRIALFNKQIVDKAVVPVFSGLEGFYAGMLGFFVVSCCVLVFRAVTAADMSAAHTHPQMHPRVPHGDTFFASG